MIAYVLTLIAPLPLAAGARRATRRRRLLDRLLRAWRERLWPVAPPLGIA
jgi:hypothetical protein